MQYKAVASILFFSVQPFPCGITQWLCLVYTVHYLRFYLIYICLEVHNTLTELYCELALFLSENLTELDWSALRLETTS